MNRSLTRKSHRRCEATDLIRKHHQHVIAGPQSDGLTELVAVTFQPGGSSKSFHHRRLLPIGSATMIVMTYEPRAATAAELSMPFCGFTASAKPDGSVLYGGENGQLFQYDASLAPCPEGSRGAINAFHEPRLVELVLRLHHTCRWRLHKSWLPDVPRLPRILLSFAPNELPQFEDTPSLRNRAAIQLGMRVGQLGKNGPTLLRRLLEDVWQQHLIQPDAPENPTGTLLVDAELCTQARRPLAVYEDFRELVGQHVWNPILGTGLLRVDNPARQVLRRFNIDTTQDFNQFFPEELIAKIQQAMRDAIGVTQHRLTREEILDGLMSPEEPITGYVACLPRMRARLGPSISECTSNDDLLRAARNPDRPLLASDACRIQVLRSRAVAGMDRLHFTPEVLRRRIVADLQYALPVRRPGADLGEPGEATRTDLNPVEVAFN
jgi:hypothetical protein